MVLDSNDLVYVRHEAETTLVDTADIQRGQATPDNLGGYTHEWSTIRQGVSARIVKTRGDEKLVAAGVDVVAEWMVTLPHDTDVTESDRLIYKGTTYEVIFVNRDQTNQTALRVALRRVG